MLYFYQELVNNLTEYSVNRHHLSSNDVVFHTITTGHYWRNSYIKELQLISYGLDISSHAPQKENIFTQPDAIEDMPKLDSDLDADSKVLPKTDFDVTFKTNSDYTPKTLHPNTPVLHVWKSEKDEDEYELLEILSRKLENCQKAYGYNSTSFHLPYLKNKYKAYGLPNPFDQVQHTDLLQECKQIGKALNLSLKLSDLRLYFQEADEVPEIQVVYDCFSLLQYAEFFEGNFSAESVSFGEPFSAKSTAFKEPFSAESASSGEQFATKPASLREPFSAESASFEESLSTESISSADSFSCHGNSGNPGNSENCFYVTLTTLLNIQRPLHINHPVFYLMLENTSAKVQIRLFNGKLRVYYVNYEDYYYLPEEDMIIHKSMASGIAKEKKEKATYETCYHYAQLPAEITCGYIEKYLKMLFKYFIRCT